MGFDQPTVADGYLDGLQPCRDGIGRRLGHGSSTEAHDALAGEHDVARLDLPVVGAEAVEPQNGASGIKDGRAINGVEQLAGRLAALGRCMNLLARQQGQVGAR